MNLYTIFGSRFLFPLHERLKGHETLAILKDLERSQWLSSEQLQTLQAQRLSDFLSKITDCVPYFRNQREISDGVISRCSYIKYTFVYANYTYSLVGKVLPSQS